jgi:uncharacterized protein YdhG (YjbR/CyaY superfamily)
MPQSGVSNVLVVMRGRMMKRSNQMATADAGTKEVEDYLAALPESARGTLSRIRAMIRSAVPKEATEGIGYGMPVFRYKGTLIGYAAFPGHCGLYPMSPAVIAALQNELRAYKTSKGTVRFPVDKPLPAALVKKLVKARVEEVEQKNRR